MSARFYPYLLAIVTMFFWGIAPIFGKLGLTKINPFLALAIRSFVIAIIMLVIVAIRGDFRELAGLDIKSVSFIAIEGVLASLIGHFAYYYALRLGETSRIVPIASAFPIITIAAAAIFLSEKITILKGAGAVLILAGIFLLRF